MKQSTDIPLTAPTYHSYSILILDDALDNLFMLTEILKRDELNINPEIKQSHEKY